MGHQCTRWATHRIQQANEHLSDYLMCTQHTQALRRGYGNYRISLLKEEAAMSKGQTITMSATANRVSRDAIKKTDLVTVILYFRGMSEEQEQHVGWAIEFGKPILVWRRNSTLDLPIPQRILDYGNFETFEGTNNAFINWLRERRLKETHDAD